MPSSDRVYREALRNNKTFFIKLTKEMEPLGKKALAAGAAAALEVAMDSPQTVHDSSRAAANWDLNIGGVNPYGRSTSEMAPAEYGDTIYGIGHRSKPGDGGTRGAQRSLVMKRKRHKYGYLKKRGGASVEVVEGSWINNALRIHEKGRVAVHLFNPILGGIPSYARNAFPGFAAAKDEIDNKVRTSAQIAVIAAVKEINAKIRNKFK